MPRPPAAKPNEWDLLVKRIDVGKGEKVRYRFPDAMPIVDETLAEARELGATDDDIDAAIEAGCIWFSSYHRRFVRWEGRGPILFGKALPLRDHGEDQ